MKALLFSALLLLPLPARAEDVTVFAAASLRTALDLIAADWQADTGHRVVISYGGSSALAQQIEQGAPADLFFSAAVTWMDHLQAAGLIQPDSRRDLLGNSLVLVAHRAADPVVIDATLNLPALLGDGRLAMALVDSVPAGQYGRAALESLGLWAAVAPLVVQTENVRAALDLVMQGEAALGIVYASDALFDDAAGDAVTVIGTFPATTHPPIIYPAALVADRPGAAAALFLDHLGGPQAMAVFAAQGFRPL
jgi:molybdate transport system substrate-binding protein